MVRGMVNMKGVTGNDGDVKTGVGTMPHEVKRRLRKTMRGKSSGAAEATRPCGVKTTGAPCGQERKIPGYERGGIDAGETGGKEPARRLSGGHCRRS